MKIHTAPNENPYSCFTCCRNSIIQLPSWYFRLL